MPKNTVNKAAAAKAKKQKIFLIVGGVLLLGLGALQGPKLLKHGGGEAAPPPVSSVRNSDGSSGVGQPVSETPALGTAAASTPAVVVTGKKVGSVAGVALVRGATVTPATNQLVSFTLFDVKDPFVPGEDSTPALTAEQKASDAYYNAHGEAPPAGSEGASAAGQGGTSTGAPAGAGAPVKPTPPPAPIYATIDFDGKAQQMKVKDQFPAEQPLFVLKKVTKKKAKIAVAGGSFDDSETFTLKLNKKVTLVNTATGVRYELKLVYTGATPEVIEGFTTTTPTGASGATGTTDTSTTTDTTSTANAG